MLLACDAAATVLRGGGPALDAVEAAVRVLEDSNVTNAGQGSNLTLEGRVECDASIMDAASFGAVAAAPGIRNPIAAAAELARDNMRPLSHDRVRPMVLAGDRARMWALARGLDAAADTDQAQAMHVTGKAKRKYEKYMAMLAEGDEAHTRGKADPADDHNGHFFDTVGCVVIDTSGCPAAGVSSGGIWVKFDGRVGEAAAYGAGCWACCEGEVSLAASVSGVGERIMKHLVAREVCVRLKGCVARNEPPQEVCKEVLQSTVMMDPLPNACGFICASARRMKKKEGLDALEVEITAAHCARSMAVGVLLGSGHGGSGEVREALILRREGSAVQHVAYGTCWDLAC
jgi:taspase, threonine aspartase, 1